MRYAIGKVSGVFMDHDVAVKFFGIRGKAVKEVRGTIEECYARELLCLQRLQGTPGFPSIISHKDDDLILEMEDCGECLFNTWHEYDLTLYLDQANRICDALEKANIQYFFAGLNKPNKPPKPPIAYNPRSDFPLSNLCIKDGELTLIDFEMANPVGSHLSERLHPRLKALYENYNPDHFREFLLTGLRYPKESFDKEMWRKIPASDFKQEKWNKMKDTNPREVYKTMTSFNQPSEKIVNEWKKYQKRYGIDQAVDRVEKMKLASVCTGKTVVDIGCNDGYITGLVSEFASSATGVEPHVELTEDKPANVTWVRSTFNEFLDTKPGTFDVLLSLAVSIQLRDFGGLTEQEIVNGYYSLLPVGGIVVHETQKLENRPNNQEHTAAMIAAFKTKFVQIDHGDARGSGKREYYHFRKEV